MIRTALLILSITGLLAANAANAEDYVITLKDQKFEPETIELPAHQKIKLTVRNEQNKPAEFESEELDREKVVAAGSEVIVNLGPLEPGSYAFVDDFHHDTKGTIVVK